MSADLVVIGLGYVGLPLMVRAVEVGLKVTGLDVSQRVVDSLNAGHSHVDDIDDATIAASVAAGFRATTDASVLADAATVVVCVPTPLGEDGGPDLGAVTHACQAIAAHLHPGMLVVLESTTYPGTTDELVRPMLEQASGLKAGVDFWLAFSPERIDPGNPTFGLQNTPKVVGGHTPQCTANAAAFYGKLVQTVVQAKGTREAELAKLLENTYRHVNIALVNEMAIFCRELDVDLWDAIDCAKTKPFGFQAFYPGPGVGGHCIPIDPNYLSYKVRTLGYPFRFVELAQEINARMPNYVVHRVQDLLNQHSKPLRGSRVLLLGVTYKADIADQRESPAKPLARQLMDRGALLHFHDPHVPSWSVEGTSVPRVADAELDQALREMDLVVLLQAHSAYDVSHVADTSGLLFDTRGVVRRAAVESL